MQIGYIGLGKMGSNMVERLLIKKYEVIGFDSDKNKLSVVAGFGMIPAQSVADLVGKLKSPKLIWLMLPYEKIDEVLGELAPLLDAGDTIIDGGNTPYWESVRRAKDLADLGINFLDVGVSGGPSGAKNGACLMIGGEREVFDKYEKLFKDLSAKDGYAWLGRNGAGHFTKMVHNGIEYGMMQAIAEGFAVLKASPFKLSLTQIANLYNHKSVIESRLIGWVKEGLEQYGENLKGISGSVEHSGEGLWTVEVAKKNEIIVPVISESLKFRLDSKDKPSYMGQMLMMMRGMFGGHRVSKKS